MFPYVCAAMIPVFCDPTTTSKLLRIAIGTAQNNKPMAKSVVDEESKSVPSIDKKPEPTTSVDEKPKPNTSVEEETECKPIFDEDSKYKLTMDYESPSRGKQNAIASCICAYAVLQMFLPYSHFVTQGYNGWRNGMYGYSWDMMVYNMDVARIQVKVMDHTRREQYFLDPHNWTENNKWVLHGDMIRQFAECVATANVARDGRADVDATNVSVYMDVWASLNGRFHQRMVDPAADILHDPWTPWTPVPWLLPLLSNFDRWRPMIADFKNEMDQKDGQLLFFADFPGMTVTNYYNDNGQNATATVGTNATFSNATIITLAVLEGAVAVRNLRDDDGTDDHDDVMQHLLVSGEAINVTGQHSVTTMGATPSCYVLYVDATTGTSTVASVAVDDSSRPSRRCSDACYTFVVDAIKTTLFAIFS